MVCIVKRFIIKIMKKFIKSLSIIQIMGILSLFFLVSAYFIQYAFDILPCKLCTYQRFLYFLLLVLGLIASVVFIKSNYYKVLLIFCRFIIILQIFLAIYHVGIERDFFQEVIPCTVESSSVTLEGLRKQIHNNRRPSCKEVGIRFLGLSLAEINLLISIMLLILSFRRKTFS